MTDEPAPGELLYETEFLIVRRHVDDRVAVQVGDPPETASPTIVDGPELVEALTVGLDIQSEAPLPKIVMREIDCPACDTTFYADALATEVIVEVHHDSIQRGSHDVRLAAGESVEFRNDEPSVTSVAVREREPTAAHAEGDDA